MSCTAAPVAEVTPAPTPSPSASSASPAGVGGYRAPAPRTVALGNGLVVDLPAWWSVAGERMVNRATYRLLIASNGAVDTVPELSNGDVDAAALPAGRVVFTVERFCRLSCRGPETETPMPPDWATATVLHAGMALPPDRHEVAVGFRWFDEPLFAVARWSDGAPADLAEIARIVASIRPEPAPPRDGEYRGWTGMGALTGIPVGTVRLVPLPPGAIVQRPGRIYDLVPFFVVRGRQGIYAFISRPLHDERCEIGYDRVTDRFACSIDGRTYEWTRFGTYLGPEPASDLPQHRVIVRDGLVWVNYARDVLLSPTVKDEAAER